MISVSSVISVLPALALFAGLFVFPHARALAVDTKYADTLFAQRAEPAKLEAACKAYEDAGAWARAAFCCTARLELYEDLKKDSQKEPWIERGMKDAAKALGVKDPDDVPDQLASFAKKDAGPLFSWAACYGRKIELSSWLKQAFMVGKLRKVAERAAELDATVYYGAPDRMLAELYASAPGAFGGDIEKAKAAIKAAVETAPKLLQNYCTRAIVERESGDRAAARADLQRVLSGDVHAIPGLEVEQEASKRDAKALLEKLGK
ncbi:MAG TPA: TRAP transporter TatT component family protein [Planctomycetota bacterium]|nr:TRAP transporter TatT component family protein [Planctomycetota bacterium]